MEDSISKLNRPILIAVAWPYVNGAPHVGHFAGALLPADIIARYHRIRGNRVLMVSGSDCFGTPITVEADSKQTSPKAIADLYHPLWQSRIQELKLSYDLYTSTLTENHKVIVQDFFNKILSKGFISKGSSNQYFSESENRFLPDRYVEGVCPKCGAEHCRSDQCDTCGSVLQEGELLNPISKTTGSPTQLKETEHYFLNYDQLQPFLTKYVAQNEEHWRKWIRAETNKWLNEGLKPRAITRDLDWGIEIPTGSISKDELIDNIESKRLYVWFDAVIGYFSASVEWANGTDRWKEFWKSEDSYHYYFMGKDNLVFHTLFWPAYLHAYDETLHLPDLPAINQYLTFGGEKFSKSRGITVDPIELSKLYGLDNLRFYVASIMPEHSDSDFTLEGLKSAVNGKLVAKIGNFINRTLNLARGVKVSNELISPEVIEEINRTGSECAELFESVQIRKCTERILLFAEFANQYITTKEPWALNKVGGPKYDPLLFIRSINDCLMLSGALMIISSPILIEAFENFNKLLKLDLNSWEEKLSDTLIRNLSGWSFDEKPEPLFAKIDSIF